jgi:YidC/Oxa1 family membrane protein insertase
MEVDKAVEAEYREASDGQLWYQLVDFFVGTLARGNAGIGLVILALLIKVMLHPMTKKQIASQRDMARLQPEMKRLQEKYKDDKQKINEEFWKLCQEHGVNPLGGCMPMIPQLIVMILVYQGIRAYVMNLSQPFLWIDSLAHPDIYLLLVYTASQFGFGKLTQTQNPAASDPQQQQTQKMMTWIMPIFLFFVFQSFPSAFILFFFVFNAVHIAQHLYINRAAELAEQAPAGAVSGGGNSGGDDEEGRPQSYAEKKSRGRGKLSNREKAKERRKRRR